ncbi:MAG: hypothetical protein J0H86_08260 [Xanthomonadaceae bacterium]|nr:hypothetical protein [Xanthomonadaceae bacterium]
MSIARTWFGAVIGKLQQARVDLVGVVAADRFPLGNPALLSAPSKKSFSSVNSPILACSALMSTVGWLGRLSPNRPDAPPINGSFHCAI